MTEPATRPSFPTYAELASTSEWAAGGAGVPVALTEPEATARYTEGPVLGVGGMGKVVMARDARIGRDVAVKVLHADRELEPADRARFLREARVQGQLEHPSIVPVYDIDYRSDGTIAFTMRRVLGRTLASIIDELASEPAGARYGRRELLSAFATVCLTVDYAHSRGVIHRDLKPSNIMLGDFGEVYVLDWGVARLVDETYGGGLVGTPLYMAPEQFDTGLVDVRADVFALGAILFELLALEPLRDPRALVVPVDARVRRRRHGAGCAPELEEVCLRATCDDPAARYPSARALNDAIAAYLEGDRALEQRRAIAADHGRAARAALSTAGMPAQRDRAHGVAMHELALALAADPTERAHVELLAELLAKPPEAVPPEVQLELDVADQALIRHGARYNLPVLLGWLLFVPLALGMGVRDGWEMAGVIAPIAIAVVIAVVTLRLPVIPRPIQLVEVALFSFATMGLSRMFGALVLVPTLAATYAITWQAHPDRVVRATVIALSCAALLVPLAFELTGVLPPSYVFEHGAITIVPRGLELPRGFSVALLTLASLTLVIVPCTVVSRVRAELGRAERDRLLQAWQFRRLANELIGQR